MSNLKWTNLSQNGRSKCLQMGRHRLNWTVLKLQVELITSQSRWSFEHKQIKELKLDGLFG